MIQQYVLLEQGQGGSIGSIGSIGSLQQHVFVKERISVEFMIVGLVLTYFWQHMVLERNTVIAPPFQK